VARSLLAVLAGVAVLATLTALILRKGIWGPLILLALAASYFGVTVLSELVKTLGKKVPGRDRHP